ncbi:ribonuclease H-like domain-containing protein [Tanacetum coccineum]
MGSPQQGVHYPQQGVQTLSGLPQGVHFVPGTSQPPIQFTTGVQQQQGGSFPGSVHLGQSPSMPFHPSQLFASGSQGASSQLNDSVYCLSDILNMCIYLSVAVGDGRFIPVTNSGHSVLSTPFRPLRLNNVLITPNIVKNLISVRQFVRDNSCTVEFDPFGFSVKDFITRWVLLRFDICGINDLDIQEVNVYVVFLSSENYFLINKETLPDPLPCLSQLGKHEKLPFVSIAVYRIDARLVANAISLWCLKAGYLRPGFRVTRDSFWYVSVTRKYAHEENFLGGVLHMSWLDLAGVLFSISHSTRPDLRMLRQQLFSSTTDSLIAYSDADWAGCPTTRRSTSGIVFFMATTYSHGPLIVTDAYLRSKCVRLSYELAVPIAVAETCWIRNLLRELHTPLSSATIV